MRFVVTNAQMKSAEQRCDREFLSYFEMMKNAGEQTAKELLKLIPSDKKTVVLCGGGNNGGDGFVIAYTLLREGREVSVVLVGGEPRTDCAKSHYDILRGTGGARILLAESCLAAIEEAHAAVDCVFGTGFHGALPDDAAEVIALANHCRLRVAVDVPSGVNSDTGEYDKRHFSPTHTFVLAAMKMGLTLPCCADILGTTKLLDIGIPECCYYSEGVSDYSAEIIDEGCKNALPARLPSSHKGTFGKLLNIAGSLNYCGAAALSTLAALRSGVGLCTLAAPVSAMKIVASSVHEATYLPLPETETGFVGEDAVRTLYGAIENVTAVSVGCGMGRSEKTRKITEFVIKNASCPVVIDADGINSICENIDILKERCGETVLTPHPLEFSRISGLSVKEIQSARIESTKKFAEEYGVTLVLKGANTVVAASDGRAFVNTCGNVGLAKGGSGDVLTGIIASFAAQGVEAPSAAICGVYCHASAADLLLEKTSMASMLPSDVISALQLVL